MYQWGITTVTLDMKWDLTYTAMYPSATLDDERWYIFFWHEWRFDPAEMGRDKCIYIYIYTAIHIYILY